MIDYCSMNTSLKRVGFGRRFLAYLIDIILVSAMNFFVGVLVGLIIVPNEAPYEGIVFIMLFNAPVFGVYCIILEGRFGQTIGKRLLHMKVVKENGERTGYLKAFIRRISLLIPILNIVDSLFILRKNKQRLFDQFANTIVVKHDNQKILTIL